MSSPAPEYTNKGILFIYICSINWQKNNKTYLRRFEIFSKTTHPQKMGYGVTKHCELMEQIKRSDAQGK
jgi:hypothetical protein